MNDVVSLGIKIVSYSQVRQKFSTVQGARDKYSPGRILKPASSIYSPMSSAMPSSRLEFPTNFRCIETGEQNRNLTQKCGKYVSVDCLFVWKICATKLQAFVKFCIRHMHICIIFKNTNV